MKNQELIENNKKQEVAIKNFLYEKAKNYLSDIFDNYADSLHLCVINVFRQIINEYSENGLENYDLRKLSFSTIDKLISSVEEKFIFNININDMNNEYNEMFTDGQIMSVSDYIERKLYWRIADIIDIEKED